MAAEIFSRPLGPEQHKAIAKLFKTMDGNGTPRRAAAEDMFALARARDPFYCGMDHQVRDAEWFAGLWNEHGTPALKRHSRRFHYRLQSLGDVKMPDGSTYVRESWGLLCQAASWARYLGLVDPETFEDRRNDEVIAGIRPADPEHPDVDLEHGQLPELEAPELPWAGELKLPEQPEPPEVPDIAVPGVLVTGHGYNRDRDQSADIEIDIEKTTMDDILVPLCRRVGIDLQRGAGHLSITRSVEMLRRMEAAGKDRLCLYISDHDDSGKVMPVGWSRQAEFWIFILPGFKHRLVVRYLALTAEQIKDYKLPKAPDSDAVELDALEAIHPGLLERLILDAVAEWRDGSLEERLDEVGGQAQERADEVWENTVAVNRLQDEADGIASGYAELIGEYEEIAGEFGEEADKLLAPVRAAIKAFNEKMPPLRARYAPRVQRIVAGIGRLDERREQLEERIADIFAETEFGLPERPSARFLFGQLI